ncbi:MAG: tandem-95 repeat protein, partial [Burkholderiales bacterium]|nr:tandem-95 repeat protein [Burkholderiales bacterium]
LLGGAGNDWLEGGSGSDILIGGSGSDELDADWDYTDTANDFLDGGSGDDYVYASISNDLLIGGTGDDEVSGDDGNDVVLFNRGDGGDWYYVDESGNGVPLAQRTDTISLGGGITYADLSFERDWDDLILNVGNGESIDFTGWFDTSWLDNKAISRLQIVAEAMADFDSQSADPLWNKRIQQFDFAGLADQFEADLAADPGITTWQLAPHLADFSLGGSDTEAIGGDMAYLYGKNGNLDGLTEAELHAQLEDATFGTQSQTLTKTISAAGTGVFDDVDFIHGDKLTYSATLADGSALPAWLVFDAATGTFSGTPDHTAVGIWNVSVTATDTAGATATTSFALDVEGVAGSNVAPTLDHPLTDQSTLEDDAFTFTVPADTFSDADFTYGDTLNYSATLADGNPLPDWLLFDAATGTFSGTPDNWDVGSLTVTVTATDTGELTASSTFALDVLNVNDAPVVASTLQDASAIEDQPFSFDIPADAFNDDDFVHGDNLSYGATLADGSVLPSWLNFDAATGTFGGTPLNADVGNLNLAVTASDSGGLTASSLFALSVANINDSPTAADDVGAAEEDGGAVILSAASLLSNDTDPDAGDTLSIVGVSQAASGAGVSLIPSTASGQANDVQYDIGDLYQSLGVGQTTSDTFSYTISDAEGTTSSANVVMTITGVNDAPVTVDDAAAVQEDGALLAGGNVLANDSDVDNGTVLTVAAPGSYAGAYGTLDLAADGSYTYTLDNAAASVQALGEGQSVADAFAYAATDSTVSTPATLRISIAGANDAPDAADDAAAVQEDAALVASGNVLANDSDVDNGTVLTVAAPGSYAGTYGTLDLAADGSYTYTLDNAAASVQALGAGQSVAEAFAYAATDGSVSTPATLTISIAGTNDAPDAVDDAAAVQEDAALIASGNVLANDSDVDNGTVLTVAAPGSYAGTYGMLDLSADGSYTYTLDNAAASVQALGAGQSVAEAFAYAATDGSVSTPATLAVNIAGANDAPVVVNPIADQDAAGGSPFNFTVAADAFTDIDLGDSLAYAATLADGTPLPSWLAFDAATRTFTGTPPGGSGSGGKCGSGSTGSASSLQLRVEATDTSGASAFDEFALNIAGGGSTGSGDDDDHSHHGDGGSGHGDDHHGKGSHGDDHHGNDHHGDDHHAGDGHDGGRGDDKSQCRDERDAIAARLQKRPNYDFSSLSAYLAQHQGGGYGVLTAAQVAQQWRNVQDRVGQLAQDDEVNRRGAHGGENYGGDDGFARGATYWGYAGSTGQNRSCGGMATFGGLDEGFRKLG